MVLANTQLIGFVTPWQQGGLSQVLEYSVGPPISGTLNANRTSNRTINVGGTYIVGF